VLAGEVVDGTFMSVAKLREFLAAEVADAKDKGILFSLHMKATMMKVSDPIILVNVNNGLGNLLAEIQSLPADTKSAIEADIQAAYDNGPALAMVNSDKGITNLHVPSDVIIDASMPAMIRTSGQMWNAPQWAPFPTLD